MQCILNKGAERKSAKMKKNLKVLSIAILAGSLAAAGVVTATYFGGGLKNVLPMHAEESNTMMIRVSAADIAAGIKEGKAGEFIVSGTKFHVDGASVAGSTATISGGTLVAVGASGMAQNFSTDSTQGSMLVTVSDTLTEGELSLTDSNGNVLVSCSPSKGYNSVAVSCPKLSEGETYTLTTGDTTPVKILFSIVPSSASYQYSDGLFPSHPAPD